jgi:hypothetical protein
MKTRLIILALVAAAVGLLIWHFFVPIVMVFTGFHIWRLFLRKHGYGKARRTVKGGGVPAWIEAASLARIALSFGGVTTKRETIPSRPLARYALRSRKTGPSDDPDDIPF